MTAPFRPAPVEVEPPAIERYAYGLLSAARIAPTGERRWEVHGVVYNADSCALSGGLWLDPCEETPDDPTEVTSFVVTLDKAAGVDVLTATLTSRPGI